ncbi:MAG: peptide deformylase [Nitrospinae bacterium]|nr:peptide deformylase [Nitrospinota bacterium]
MTTLKVRTYPDPILGKNCTPVDNVNDEVLSLINKMIETMLTIPGIGLAAPQIGVSVRIIVVDMSLKEINMPPLSLINPEISESENKMSIKEEGCLSIPEIFGEISRSERIEVKGLDIEGKEIVISAEGFLARIFQHEIDHLNGFLFWDRMSKIKRDILKRRFKKMMMKKRVVL